MPLAEKGVQGKGAAALVPAQRWKDPERDQRSDSQMTGSINTTPLVRLYQGARVESGRQVVTGQAVRC
jgi:hypothetical protein